MPSLSGILNLCFMTNQTQLCLPIGKNTVHVITLLATHLLHFCHSNLFPRLPAVLMGVYRCNNVLDFWKEIYSCAQYHFFLSNACYRLTSLDICMPLKKLHSFWRATRKHSCSVKNSPCGAVQFCPLFVSYGGF